MFKKNGFNFIWRRNVLHPCVPDKSLLLMLQLLACVPIYCSFVSVDDKVVHMLGKEVFRYSKVSNNLNAVKSRRIL